MSVMAAMTVGTALMKRAVVRNYSSFTESMSEKALTQKSRAPVLQVISAAVTLRKVCATGT